MLEKPYYLGLDMGTNSVGWAVTDQQYNLLKAKGKDLWGIREFAEADTSVERRTHRISRRRRQREQARMHCRFCAAEMGTYRPFSRSDSIALPAQKKRRHAGCQHA